MSSTTPSELAEFYLRNYYKKDGRTQDYLRCQVSSTANMMSVGDKAVAGMKADGLRLWEENKE